MEAYSNPYSVAAAQPSVRAQFIRNTYIHLAGAILAFAAIEYVLINHVPAARDLAIMMSRSWLIVIGLFMGASWIADRWARSATSPGMQYLGLGVFVVAEAFIFLPMLFRVDSMASGGGVIAKAGVTTLALFVGLTAVVFTTKKDFSFLRTAITVGGFVALGLVVAGAIFGFSLGLVFAGAMVVLAGASILYQTSNIVHHYQPTQHVSASLGLFSSVALMFYYLLMFFTGRD